MEGTWTRDLHHPGPEDAKNEQLKSTSPKKVIEFDQLDQLKIRKNVNQNL